MVFPNMDAFKKAVKDYAVYEGKPIKLPKNDKVRCRAIYFEPCPWKLLCSQSKDIQCYQIKTFNDVHTCCRVSRIQQADSKWLGNVLLEFLRTNPRLTITDIHNYLKLHYNLIVPNFKAYRAWEKAKSYKQLILKVNFIKYFCTNS